MSVLLVLLVLVAGLIFIASLASRRHREWGRFRNGPNPLIYLVALLPFLGFILLLRSSHGGSGEEILVLLSLAAAVAFLTLWIRELITLMGLGDDAFPGRHDKVLWLALLVLLPPIGLLTFSIFRRVYWPIEKPVHDASAHDLV